MLLNRLAVQTSVALKARGILLSFLPALILLKGLAIVFQLLKNASCCSHVQNGWHCRRCYKGSWTVIFGLWVHFSGALFTFSPATNSITAALRILTVAQCHLSMERGCRRHWGMDWALWRGMSSCSCCSQPMSDGILVPVDQLQEWAAISQQGLAGVLAKSCLRVQLCLTLAPTQTCEESDRAVWHRMPSLCPADRCATLGSWVSEVALSAKPSCRQSTAASRWGNLAGR